jgi:hypothetical protein
MPSKSANVKNEKQYEALKDKGMSKERSAKIANSPDASKHGGKKSGSGGDSKAGRHDSPEEGRRPQGGKATARKSSMAQLTNLETELGEVIGLAMAAQGPRARSSNWPSRRTAASSDSSSR